MAHTSHFYYYLVCVLFIQVFQIEGYCYFAGLQSSPSGNSDLSGTDYHCEDANGKYKLNENWKIGYPQCVSCTCGDNYVSCCGYGVKAGSFGLPPDCKMTDGTCDIKPVKKDNPLKPCFEK